jgi:hypothetical protein
MRSARRIDLKRAWSVVRAACPRRRTSRGHGTHRDAPAAGLACPRRRTSVGMAPVARQWVWGLDLVVELGLEFVGGFVADPQPRPFHDDG